MHNRKLMNLLFLSQCERPTRSHHHSEKDLIDLLTCSISKGQGCWDKVLMIYVPYFHIVVRYSVTLLVTACSENFFLKKTLTYQEVMILNDH